MENAALIQAFYTAFAAGNAEAMVACYHPDIVFSDPAFGELKGKDACNMWRMLISRSKGNIKISFSDVQATATTGSAKWVAEYNFGQTGRKVINRINADFVFSEGRIIRHNDNFNLHQWAGQALGWKGKLLGGTSFMQKKIRANCRSLLQKFAEANP